MLHTPVKETSRDKSPRMDSTSPKQTETTGSSSKNETSQVRRSIGEWETKGPLIKQSLSNQTQKANVPQEAKERPKRASEAFDISPGKVKEQVKPTDRVTQARVWLRKAKTHLSESRNLKTDLKVGITMALDEMYKLIKEEAGGQRTGQHAKRDGTFIKEKSEKGTVTVGEETNIDNREVIKMLQWQKQKIEDTHLEMGKVREAITNLQNSTPTQMMTEVTSEVMTEMKQQSDRITAAALDVAAVKNQISHVQTCIDKNRITEGISYAAAAASKRSTDHPLPQVVHSVVVSSLDAHDTSEDVLNKIRTAVSARTTGIRVDRLRKARDQKVVLGCQSREEVTKIIERLKADSPTLQIKEVANKDPLVILFGVLNVNTDEEVLAALKRQNGHILGSIPEPEYRTSVKYRRKARNPLESHVVLQVSPPIWQNLTTVGKVHVDLQRVFVKDQTPLVQCSRCLGYGHGRKTCKESTDTCSHCTGPHLRGECPVWKAGEKPTCRNCQSAKLDQMDHNCFEDSCPIRKKWDALARARVAYC